jgi:tetratricopeptide (TPR) repeat protein
VGEAISFKYRAFLSYSHKDTSWAKWVHDRIEGFRIDKELVGRDTPMGPIPKNLRPVFRDRHDFDAGGTLRDQTIAALDGSAALVVLCSPASARSGAVNEEVRQFLSRHPDRPVVPLILDGTPRDEMHECFPKTLRFTIAANGAVTDQSVDVLAADVRESGDGRELALAKVVARLIGLAPDEVFRRAKRERRRQARVRNGVIAAMAILGLATAFWFWRSLKAEVSLVEKQQTLSEIVAVVAKYSSGAQVGPPGGKRGLAEAISAIATGAATDPRYAEALDLLKAGRPAEAEPLLSAVAEEKAARAQSESKQAAEAYLDLGVIAGFADPKRAREAYARAAALDPDNINALYLHGWFENEAGNLDGSERAYRHIIALNAENRIALNVENRDLVFYAHLGLGGIQIARGDLIAAKIEYQEAEAISTPLVQAEPNNGEWQRGQATLYTYIGDVLLLEGNIPEALKNYRAGQAIFQRLAEAHPDDTEPQLDLGVINERIGDVQITQGDLSVALKSYEIMRDIVSRLAKVDSKNARWQSQLSKLYIKFGDVQVQDGNLPEALKSYRDSLDIADRLANSDPNDAEWRSDLSLSYRLVGKVLAARGDLSGALKSYRVSLEITERLVAADPNNANWQRDLSVDYAWIGDVLMAQRNLDEALKYYSDSLAITAKADPNNLHWQRNLSTLYNSVGDVLMGRRNLNEALKNYRDSLTSAERVAKAAPNNEEFQFDLSASHRRLADAFRRGGDFAQAREHLAAGHAILALLVEGHPDRADWKSSLVWFDEQLAEINR